MTCRIVFLVVLCLLGSCRENGEPDLTILAASSLKKPLEGLLNGEKVSFAGSQDLSAQIAAGAPADVFLCAAKKYIDGLASKGLIDPNKVVAFAKNELTIIFRSDLQPPLRQPEDLFRPELRVVLGAVEVPIGKATREFLDQFKDKSPNVKSFEQSDLALVSKVRLGEADAAIVYQSDVGDDPKLMAVKIPSDRNVTVTYYAAPVGASKNMDRASQFVRRLLNPEVQNKLRQAGLLAP